ncbi:protein BIC1 [Macadamia integrifolia]|uniref:protein BIC1 n=1 Tax=Macadamia integrifolia TaxID=60698 RepID=UPI001C4F624B|nr:protein BIC1 [Macadamia integrifolia]
MSDQNSTEPSDRIPSSPSRPRDLDEKQSKIQELEDKEHEPEEKKQVKSQAQFPEEKDHKNSSSSSSEEEVTTAEVDSGRERLKRHRNEVAGHVWIPEIWGKEELLKDWMDCSAFNASLVPSGIMSARAALIEEGRRPNSVSGGHRLRIDNSRCPVSL